MPRLINIAVVGNGNTGSYFSKVLKTAEMNMLCFARTPRPDDFALDDLYGNVTDFDLILLCVNDTAIKEVSQKLPETPAVIAHVSGGMGINQIDEKHSHRGVFYPLMSLKDQTNLPPESIPFCLEAQSESDMELLADIVKRLKATYYPVNSEKRVYLHLAAVLAQNFTNHLYHLSRQTLQEVDMDFRILMPLIENSVQKLKDSHAHHLQTGPAVRGDDETIKRHLALLKNPLTKEIYHLLTQSIQQSHE